MLYRKIDLAADVQKARPRVQQFVQTASFAKGHLRRSRYDVAGQGSFPLLGVDATTDGKAVRPYLIHTVGVELYIRVDPHRLIKPVDQGVGGHLVAALVDGGEAAHASHRVAAPLQFLQGPFTAGMDETGKWDKHHAFAAVERVFGYRTRRRSRRGRFLPAEVDANGQRPAFGGEAGEIKHGILTEIRIQGFRHIEDAHAVRALFRQAAKYFIILLPIAPNSFLPVGQIVLRKAARPQWIVIPANARLLGPVVGGLGVVLVEEADKTGRCVFPRPFEPDDVEVGFGVQGVFQIGQVERGGVAQDARPARPSPAGEAFADEPAALVALPRQPRRPLPTTKRRRFTMLL